MASIGRQIGNSILGRAEKAVLTIMDNRERIVGPSRSPQELAANVRAMASGFLQSEGDDTPTVPAPSVKRFAVQFNPSSLNIYSHASPIIRKSLRAADAVEVQKQEMKNAASTLTVQLIFDQVNIHDAFMAEKYSLTAQSAGMGAAELAARKTFSVRPYINGLLAATMNPLLKQVAFSWAAFTFSGTLTEANAEYTMFSVSGQPVRGTVDLRIEQDHQAADAKQTGKNFDSAFGGAPETAVSGGANPTRKFSNLLGF